MSALDGKAYYECHITIESANKDKTKQAVEVLGWKFSAIDGDPVLGAGVKCYATRHYNHRHDSTSIVSITNHTASLLHDIGEMVTRRKVELVIFDSRSVSVAPAEQPT